MFTGCVKDWKAFSKWNVSDGGLDYLEVSCFCCTGFEELETKLCGEEGRDNKENESY